MCTLSDGVDTANDVTFDMVDETQVQEDALDVEVAIKDLATAAEVTAALVARQALVVPPSSRRLSEEL